MLIGVCMKDKLFLISILSIGIAIIGCESSGSSRDGSQVASIKCSNCGTKGQQRYRCTKCGKEFCQSCEKKMQTINNPSVSAHGICPNWRSPNDGHDFTVNL
jgi:hypothetical protein